MIYMLTDRKTGDLKSVWSDVIEKLFGVDGVVGDKFMHKGKQYRVTGKFGNWILVKLLEEKK